ncbi:MAG TPA: STAS domain-containing protein [Steroidobacteraceae bacterium]|nr:STAS domain-containing protein [Steroidobacteraceae bacterium]
MARAAAELAEKGEGRCAVSGALTFETAPWLWQQLQEGAWLTRAREADLSGVTTADSAGLALLIAWRAAALAGGGALKFGAVPERLLALARLTDAEALLQA